MLIQPLTTPTPDSEEAELSRLETKEQTRIRHIVQYITAERHISEDGKSFKSLDVIAKEATNSSLNRPLLEVLMKHRYPEIYDKISAKGRMKILGLQKAQRQRELDQLAAIEAMQKQAAAIENRVVTVADLRLMMTGTKQEQRFEAFVADQVQASMAHQAND